MNATAVPGPARRVHLAACGWFWVWAAVGIGAALAAVSLGPLLAVPVAAVAVAMARRPAIRRSAFGVLSGIGLLLLFVAYLQRQGPPGHLDPIPWLMLGLACLAGGVVGHARRRQPSQ